MLRSKVCMGRIYSAAKVGLNPLKAKSGRGKQPMFHVERATILTALTLIHLSYSFTRMSAMNK